MLQSYVSCNTVLSVLQKAVRIFDMDVLNGYVFWGVIISFVKVVMVKPCMLISYLTRENVFHNLPKSGFTCFKIKIQVFKLQLSYMHNCPSLSKQYGIVANRNLMITWRWLAPMSNHNAFEIKRQIFDLHKTYLFQTCASLDTLI